MSNRKNCLFCEQPLTGRSDKKYCDHYCKSAYQYQKRKNRPESFYDRVNAQLRLNRKLLKHYNRAGKSIIRAETLHKQGFDPAFFTHYWKNRNKDVYFFVYEYGFLKRTENARTKYILVMWQDYMQKT